jgi:geranylgeranyl pyrophosphate synthase
MTTTQPKAEFGTWLQTHAPEIQIRLKQSLEGLMDERVPSSLHDAVSHALLGGGKSVRPALVLLGCSAIGHDSQKAWPAAIAVEMIHAYSLIHDDLPCMDDDLLRRGRPTVHAVFGEATAVLAGDALQCMAFEVLAKQKDHALAAAQIRILANAAGPAGMVGGQVLDMALEGMGGKATLSQVEEVHRGKTGALLAASLLLGAEIAGASAAWKTYAQAVGLLFQATDDLLDATGTTDELGKTAGKDLAAQKATLVAVLGLDGARVYAQRLASQASSALKDIPPGPRRSELLSLPNFLLDRCR